MGLVRSLCEASAEFDHILWVGRKLPIAMLVGANARVHPYFYRRLRKLQLFLLYRRLLARAGSIVATTAGRIDLLALYCVTRRRIPAGKVFLYFHWLRLTPRKRDFFRSFAGRQPNVVVLATTPSVQALLLDCGFRYAFLMPYPVTALDKTAAPSAFRHVLFAGAARPDKGFGHVVDLVHYLAQQGESIPLSVQASGDHYEKYDAKTKSDLERLYGVRYAQLTVRPETLSTAQYQALFEGAICLQPYSPEEFGDRVSGVTLDALIAGAPVVALSRTWIAGMVERFDAGLVVDDPTPQSLYWAVRQIMDDYSAYQARAMAAGVMLRQESRWGALMELLNNRYEGGRAR